MAPKSGGRVAQILDGFGMASQAKVGSVDVPTCVRHVLHFGRGGYSRNGRFFEPTGPGRVVARFLPSRHACSTNARPNPCKESNFRNDLGLGRPFWASAEALLAPGGEFRCRIWAGEFTGFGSSDYAP